jgi:hypothetical protein
MHNDCTLDVMDNTTVSLGEKLREFSETTCPAFITRELEREVRARSRREAKKAANQKSSAQRSQNGAGRQATPHFQSADAHPDDQVQPTVTTDGQARHLKHFNLNTYKIHSLGDYTATIRKYGTTDSYSTELVSSSLFNLKLLSKRLKMFYVGRAGASLSKRALHPY